MDEVTRVGAAVRSARLRRGLSQRVVAGLTGRSQGWLSKIEQGRLPLESRHDLVALADALDVSPADLTGQPYTGSGQPENDAAATVPRIRRALQDSPDRRLAVPPDQLVSAVEELTSLRLRLDLPAVGRVLPSLLGALRASVPAARRPRDRRRVLRALFWANHAAQSAARNLGHFDLAWIAAERVVAAAQDLGDPAWIAAADFSRSHALLPTGSFAASFGYASVAADSAVTLAGAEAVGAAGSLMLAASIAAASAGRGDEAHARLDAADELAGRGPGRVFARGFTFGASNVTLHRLAVAVETGQPEQARSVARTIRPESLPSAERQAAYWLDLGRAHAQMRADGEAVKAFRAAEDIAPLRFRLHPLVREAVAGMVERRQRDAVGRELRGLAYRMALPH